jgi:methylated-DNA-[protein]-cysteine S-methyltransferase
VAAANGANALSILIPCHRVVGSNHTLIGYAGGLAAKQGMLALEADSCDGPSGSRIGQLF